MTEINTDAAQDITIDELGVANVPSIKAFKQLKKDHKALLKRVERLENAQ